MNQILCLTVASLALVTGANITSPERSQVKWIDVCNFVDTIGSTCCAPGMETKEYVVVPEDHDWHDHSLNCDHLGGWMAVFETQAELSCLVHYATEAFNPKFQRYAISLRADWGMPGIYEWQNEDGSTSIPTYDMWAASHPQDDACVAIEVGTGVDHQGQWVDGACIEDNSMHSICERTK